VQVVLWRRWCSNVCSACRISAAGKVCLIEAETVATAQEMRSRGVRGHYIHLRPPSDAALRRMVQEQLGRGPPLGHSPEDAAGLFYDHVRAQLAAADAAADTFDADVVLSEDHEAAYSMLMEAVADKFARVVPPCHVWGYGRQLWDRSRRVHGRRPLCVAVLGPAAVGKTLLAARLARSFGLLHVNAGELLFDEIKCSTPVGRRAKKHLDASVLVPDDVFNEIVWARLQAADAREVGFVLDGYPHTRPQVEFLNGKGLEPDKVRACTLCSAFVRSHTLCHTSQQLVFPKRCLMPCPQ
jgi:Adenylate kinase